MTIRVLAVAESELTEAVDYYNEQRPGLGFEFAAEIRTTFNRIADYPDAWPRYSQRTRRCLVDRFPFGVLYQRHDDDILILAIMHLRRVPTRWQDRLRDA